MLSNSLSCTQSIHEYPLLTQAHKQAHTHISFFPEQARITALLVIVIIFGMVHKFSRFLKFVIFSSFFLPPNCEPFHIASLLQKSTCFLEIQIVINKTNITYMNLNV